MCICINWNPNSILFREISQSWINTKRLNLVAVLEFCAKSNLYFPSAYPINRMRIQWRYTVRDARIFIIQSRHAIRVLTELTMGLLFRICFFKHIHTYCLRKIVSDTCQKYLGFLSIILLNNIGGRIVSGTSCRGRLRLVTVAIIMRAVARIKMTLGVMIEGYQISMWKGSMGESLCITALFIF